MKSFALFLFLLFTTLAYAGQTVLYTFKGGTDGFWPNGPVVIRVPTPIVPVIGRVSPTRDSSLANKVTLAAFVEERFLC
jgi:hypothetical protein